MKDLNVLNRGFTLVELLVAMVIISILLATGIPALTNFNNDVSVRTISDQLLNSLAFARTEAVSEVTDVTICSTTSVNGNTCGAAADWDNGWIIFSDANGDGAINAGDVVKNFVDASSSNVMITANSASITFNNKGENTGQEATTFTLTITDAITRNVTVSTVGSVSVQ